MFIQSLLLSLFSTAYCLSVQVVVPQSPHLTPAQVNDLRNLRLSINSQSSVLYPSDRSLFQIPNLPNGVYFVQVLSKHFLFEALSIEIKSGQTNIYSIHPWQRKKIAKLETARIKLLDKIEYFEPESTFALKSLLSNSYVLFLGFGAILMFCYSNLMPKLEEAQNAVEHPQQRRERVRQQQEEEDKTR